MNSAIVLSGGVGKRMNMGNLPKQYYKFKEKPIFLYSLEKLQLNTYVDNIIIVANEEWHKFILEYIQQYKINKFVGFALPGNNRQFSIFNGLKCIENLNLECSKVIIHDAARPNLSNKLINECLSFDIASVDGVLPVLDVKDTYYYSEDLKNISGIPDRSKLFLGQAPEGFNYIKYLNAHKNADCKLIEEINGSSEFAYKMGLKIKIIQGDEGNFKITTSDDLKKLELYM